MINHLVQPNVRIHRLFVLHTPGRVIRYRSWFANAEQGAGDNDMEAFEDHRPEEERLQDLDDADPTAPMKPAFPDVDPEHSYERVNDERGNRTLSPYLRVP